MAAFDFKTATPASASASALIFGAETQSSATPSIYTTTGSGSIVLATSPTLVTPTLGAASATSVNKVTITAPATSATLTIANGKTLTANNTLTLAGTDSTTMTFPSTSGTVATLNVANLFTKANTFQPDSDAQAGTFRRNSSGQTANVVEIQTEANAFLAAFDKTGALTIGAASGNTGALKLAGTTSGTVTLSTADAAGTWTMKLPTSGGTNGYVLSTDGSGNTSWVAQSGGGGTPGGSDTQIQFNNAGAFGGSSGLTWNDTTKLLTATGLGTGGGANTGGLTVSGGALTLSGNISANAWTTSGIRQKSVAATLTDLTSTGTVAAAYTNVYGGNTIAASNATTFTDYFTTFITQPTAGTNVTFTNRWALGLSGNMKVTGSQTISGRITTSSDLWLADGTIRLSGTLFNFGGYYPLNWYTGGAFAAIGSSLTPILNGFQLGQADAASPVAQTLQVQNVVAGTSNTAGANFTINGSRGTGTGAGGSIIFQVAPAGTSGTSQNALATALTIDSAKNLFIPTGTSGLVFGSSATHGKIYADQTYWIKFAFNTDVYTFNSSGQVTIAGTGSFISLNSDTTLYRGAAGVIGFQGTTSSFPALKRSSTTLQVRLADDSAFAPLACGNTTASATALDVSGTGAASLFSVTNTTTGTLFSVVNSSAANLLTVSDAVATGTQVVGTAFGLTGNISAAAWTTSGIRYRNVAATLTDTSSTGTVATAYTDLFGGNTIAASNATTFTNYATFRISGPSAGTNVTLTNAWALSLGGSLVIDDAYNIAVGSTTGAKIGTATSQKIGFWNATPIAQPTTGVASATVAATGTGDVVAASTTFDGYTVPQIVKALRNAGLLA